MTFKLFPLDYHQTTKVEIVQVLKERRIYFSSKESLSLFEIKLNTLVNVNVVIYLAQSVKTKVNLTMLARIY